MLGFLKKKSDSAREDVPREHVVDIASGQDFSDLITAESCDRAVAEGRVEPFLLVGEMFGGEAAGPNVLLGPAGVAAAKARVDDEIVTAIRAGESINFDATFDYGEGASRVPRTVRFELGALGTRVLRLWD